MESLEATLPKGRVQLAKVLSAAGDVVHVDDVARTLQLPRTEAAKRLSRWMSQGWVHRVARGAYVPVAIDTIGAKRVVLDTLEVLFASLPNEELLRAELGRLFRWLKDKNLTAIVTAERGDGVLTRHGLEEYISDCVILLDHRVTETVLTRRVRAGKLARLVVSDRAGSSSFPSDA